MNPENLGRMYFLIGVLCFAAGPFLPLLGNKLFSNREELQRQATLKSRIDSQALNILQNQHGLMFVTNNVDTVRFLIQEGLLSSEYFPSQPITYGYVLTNPGKEFLKRFPIKLYPDIIIDMHRVRYWFGYQEDGDFGKKKVNFRGNYGRDFDDCIETFYKYIPKEFIDLTVKKFNKNVDNYDDRLDIFSRYLEDETIDYVDKMKVITDWEKSIN